MSERLNIKLKGDVDASVLLKYGFVPKYDEDTGEIKEYRKKIYIEGKSLTKNILHLCFTQII